MKTIMRLFRKYLRLRLMGPLLLAILFQYSESFAALDPAKLPAAALTGEEITEQISQAYEDGTSAYPDEEGEREKPHAPLIGKVSTGGYTLNVRTGPGMDNLAFTYLIDGQEVSVLDKVQDWVKIRVPAQSGYVFGEYLQISEAETKPNSETGGDDISVCEEETSESESEPEEKEINTVEAFEEESSEEESPCEGSSDPDENNFEENVIRIDQDTLDRILSRFAKTEETSETVDTLAPLTPSGNLTLVDDAGGEGSGKQFITVVTKNDNYFYLVIDRDKNGVENVHFLNLVDESDLLSLLEDDEARAYRERQALESSIAASLSAEAAERTTAAPTESIPPSTTAPQTQPRQTGNPIYFFAFAGLLAIVVVLVVLLLLRGGIGNGKKAASGHIPEDWEIDEEEDYTEDDDEGYESDEEVNED